MKALLLLFPALAAVVVGRGVPLVVVALVAGCRRLNRRLRVWMAAQNEVSS